jgi:RND superfamily putative drug exporter
MLGWIARVTSRRPWRVVAIAVLFAVVGVVFGASGLGNLSSGGFDDSASQSIRAKDRLERTSGVAAGASLIALVQPHTSVLSGPGRAEVERVDEALRRDPGVAAVTAPSGARSPLVSRDGRSAYLVAQFRAGDDSAHESVATRLKHELAGDRAVTLGGDVLANNQVGDIIGQDIARAELLAFPILFLLSIIVFRGIVAALLPPMVGAVTVLGGFLGLSVADRLTDISTYAVNLVTGLGLGLAIDYSLFIVSRYREEMAASGPGREAIARTMRTAGRSVFFSALTVAAALSGLMVFPQGFLFSMGLGGAVVALVAAGVSLSLLPAVLTLLGRRVNAGAPKRWQRRSEAAGAPVHSGFWYRWSRFVLRRPGRMAIAGAAVMIGLALPALGISFTTVDARVLPTSASARQVDDALRADFPQDRSAPIVVAVEAPPGRQAGAAVDRYAAALRRVPGVVAVSPARPAGPGTWRVDVTPSGSAISDSAQATVRDIRAAPAPYPVLVGGQTAEFIDQKASLAAHLPAALAIIAIATLVILFLMTGSVVLAVKAIVMNALTLGATLGILTVIFQDGNLEGLLGFTSLGGVSATQPILIAALAFGLSTDYGVILLSRIKEQHDRGLPDREAVAVGLERTGRIVTAAALLFCVAIGAFATSRIEIIKEIGVGTASAVLLDATIVRAVLVPSLMGLLGRWNWWAPRPLARLHARLGLSEA